MYFDETNGFPQRKFTVGYCRKCGDKIGLTSDELREFAENMPGYFPDLLERMFKIRILLPK